MRTKAWETYKHSNEGKQLLEMFSLKGDEFEAISRIFEFVGKTDNMITSEDANRYYFLTNNILLQGLIPEGDITRNVYENIVRNFELKEIYVCNDNSLILGEEEKDLLLPATKYREKCTFIHHLSLFLYSLDDDFIPVLYPHNFHLIQQYAEEIGLTLPEIPRARDYFEYLLYYYDICMEAKKFRQEYNMTPVEFCTCLYGFAPNQAEDEVEDTSLPQPINVWFTGASKYDYKEILSQDEMPKNMVWACNERTRRGDIVVVFCLSPYSMIHSIWRAESGGRFNPFDHYHCRTTLTQCVKLEKPIKFKEFVSDSYFSQLPIVRKNLQGLNGVELSSTSYSELMRLIGERGENTAKFPKLFIPENWEPIVLDANHPEKSVEEKIVIPLLQKLGYTENDWTRQLSQKAGRKEKAIPDFVFFPKGEKHAENSPFVIEAKADMKGERDIHDAYSQGRSYANLMHAPLFANCDKERLIIYKYSGNGYNYKKPIFENHWSAIFGSVEIFCELQKIIGRAVIADTKLLSY